LTLAPADAFLYDSDTVYPVMANPSLTTYDGGG